MCSFNTVQVSCPEAITWYVLYTIKMSEHRQVIFQIPPPSTEKPIRSSVCKVSAAYVCWRGACYICFWSSLVVFVIFGVVRGEELRIKCRGSTRFFLFFLTVMHVWRMRTANAWTERTTFETTRNGRLKSFNPKAKSTL